MSKLTSLLESPNRSPNREGLGIASWDDNAPDPTQRSAPPTFTDQANDLIVTAINDLGPELENISGQLFDLGHLTYTSVTQQLSDIDDDEDIAVRELITKALITAINQRTSSPPALMEKFTDRFDGDDDLETREWDDAYDAYDTAYEESRDDNSPDPTQQ